MKSMKGFKSREREREREKERERERIGSVNHDFGFQRVAVDNGSEEDDKRRIREKRSTVES